MRGLDALPTELRDLYEVHEWRNACAVLQVEHAAEWNDLIDVLRDFRLLKSDIQRPGGNKTLIAGKLDTGFYSRGWIPKAFDTSIVVDEVVYESPTHAVDCFKNRVAVEVEWNNKDPFFDRDLNNFRLLFELRAIDVGVLITRADQLQAIFAELGRASSFGMSTTHMSKLLPKVEGGGGGGCPILVFGITEKLYVEDV